MKHPDVLVSEDNDEVGYWCNQCLKRYATKAVLERHMRTKHPKMVRLFVIIVSLDRLNSFYKKLACRGRRENVLSSYQSNGIMLGTILDSVFGS